MLLNLSKKSWTAGLTLGNFEQHNESNEKVVKELKQLADRYDKVRRGWGGKR
jgi:26S proteasome regulatory subunit N11